MTLSTKSSSKPQVAEKKIKASRKVKVELPLVEEDVKEEIREEPVSFEVGANGPAPPLAECTNEESMEEVQCPPCGAEHEELIEPITLAKKCARVRPLIDEAGNYLNPITNRYLKFGSSNFKKLLQQGIIKPRELNGL